MKQIERIMTASQEITMKSGKYHLTAEAINIDDVEVYVAEFLPAMLNGKVYMMYDVAFTKSRKGLEIYNVDDEIVEMLFDENGDEIGHKEAVLTSEEYKACLKFLENNTILN